MNISAYYSAMDQLETQKQSPAQIEISANKLESAIKDKSTINKQNDTVTLSNTSITEYLQSLYPGADGALDVKELFPDYEFSETDPTHIIYSATHDAEAGSYTLTVKVYRTDGGEMTYNDELTDMLWNELMPPEAPRMGQAAEQADTENAGGEGTQISSLLILIYSEQGNSEKIMPSKADIAGKSNKSGSTTAEIYAVSISGAGGSKEVIKVTTQNGDIIDLNTGKLILAGNNKADSKE